MADSLTDSVHPSWVEPLKPVADTIRAMGEFLSAEVSAGRGYLPAREVVLRAFSQPLDAVSVLIVGQDPYPTPGHAVGLAFSVSPTTQPLPRSLRNIFREYVEDLGYPMPRNGDLTPWTTQGVLLLNRVLTVQPGAPGSHRGRGWEQVTDCAIAALVERQSPLVAVLWGNQAQALRPSLAEVPLIQSAHPSPLSAARGFFGSRPFTRTNALLSEQSAAPIDWRLP